MYLSPVLTEPTKKFNTGCDRTVSHRQPNIAMPLEEKQKKRYLEEEHVDNKKLTKK